MEFDCILDTLIGKQIQCKLRLLDRSFAYPMGIYTNCLEGGLPEP
jgi:hypothetical protein